MEKAMQTKEPVRTAIRPDDVMVGQGALNSMTCNVNIVEYLGQVSQVSAQMNTGLRVDLHPIERLKSGEQISVWVPAEKVLLFPKEEG
jgi:putative spermidine/putrescine transport system ATP-binding protein